MEGAGSYLSYRDADRYILHPQLTGPEKLYHHHFLFIVMSKIVECNLRGVLDKNRYNIWVQFDIYHIYIDENICLYKQDTLHFLPSRLGL